MLRTVTWGGDPSKPAAGEGEHIRPRRSFATWVENVRGVAVPWNRAEIEVAEDLRRHAVEIDLGRQVARAEQAIQVRDEIVAIVSHDLKNPLSLVQSATALIRKDAEGARTGVMLERIESAVSRMNRLVSDLLDAAKIEANTFPIHASRFAVSDLVQDALALVTPLAEERAVTVQHAETQDLWVMGDHERLHQVLSNLLGNALKFTPSAGSIRVDACRADSQVRFAVTDTGSGIDPADQPHIFDRYRRPGGANARAGAGLGLYIAKGIVEAHGGRIWVESAPGHGSTFFFTIPRA
jgi:signal transduction histidine kinase